MRAQPGLAEARVLTVGELAGAIQNALERGLDRLWVVGELSNFKRHSSGHCYFTLKDEQAQISAVMWRSTAQRMRFKPTDGLEVLAQGQVRFYGPQGRVQLYVDSLEPRGLGALRAQLEALRQRLEAEGLLAPERKRPLPFLPACIGVVTARDGAALRDMLRMLRDRFAARRIVVRAVRVQGVGAEEEIAQGIRDLQGVPDVEVLIVGRGGGSIEDLWAFNDEGVARAIVASRVPVVSAVGHEIDVTIADLVADVRAPTPTAAAELVMRRRSDLEEILLGHRRGLFHGARRALAACRKALAALRARLRDPRREVAQSRRRNDVSRQRLLRAMAARLRAAREETQALADRLRQATPARLAAERRMRVGHDEKRLVAAAVRRYDAGRARVAELSAALSALSPLAALGRGYAVVFRAGESRAVRSADEVRPGDDLDVRLHRGRLRATVTVTEPAPDGSSDPAARRGPDPERGS